MSIGSGAHMESRYMAAIKSHISVKCERCAKEPAKLFFRGQDICWECFSKHPQQTLAREDPSEWPPPKVSGVIPHTAECECPRCKPDGV